MNKQQSPLVPYLALIFSLLLLAASAWSQEASENPIQFEEGKSPDVRILIDISGSMKQNDPNNLRKPAMELLVKLFPENAKAGVWTFAQWVNNLVPSEKVSPQWRQMALGKVDQISSVGLRTNIPLVFEKAMDDLGWIDKSYDTHIILLTDGMVDVSKDPEENDRARDKLLNKILPQLKQEGITIHSVALSQNADIDLMDQLAIETNGLSAVAESADDLTRIFLQAFDAAVPAEQLPLEDNQFLVDSSIEEFTALIFRKDIEQDAVLVAPDNTEYRYIDDLKGIKWFRNLNYDLITVSRPDEGEWKIIADLEPNSRVTVVSNLALQVSPLSRALFVGDTETINARLLEQGKPVDKREFLDLLTTELEIVRESDGRQWSKNLPETRLKPGHFQSSLDDITQAGVYDVYVRVDGKSFVRERKQRIEVRESIAVKVVPDDSTPSNYSLQLKLRNSDLDASSLTVSAKIREPDGNSFLRTASFDRQLDAWVVDIKGINQSGMYKVQMEADGNYLDGTAFNYKPDEIAIRHEVLGSEFVEQVPEPVEPAEPELLITPDPEPEPVQEQPAEKPPEPEPATPAPEPAPEPEQQVEEDEGNPLILYGALAGGNIILLLIGFLAYRMIRGGGESNILADADNFDDEDEEDEFIDPPMSETTIVETEEQAEPEIEEEPSLDDMEAELDAPEDSAADSSEADDFPDMPEPEVDSTDDMEVMDLDIDEEALSDVDAEEDAGEEEKKKDPEPDLDAPADTDDLLDLPDDAIDIDPSADDD